MARTRSSIVQDLKDRLEEVEGQIAQLEAKREILRELVREHGQSDRSTNGAARPKQRIRRSSPSSTTHLILNFIKERGPQPNRDVIADALEGQIKTKSDDPRRIIISTVGNLIRKKRLQELEDGSIREPDTERDVASFL